MLTEENKKLFETQPIDIQRRLLRAYSDYGHTIDDLTCSDCPLVKENCKWAWDLYNTDGDCLAEK